MSKISTLRVLFLIGTIFCNMSASDDISPLPWSEKARCLGSVLGHYFVGNGESACRRAVYSIEKGAERTKEFVGDHPVWVAAGAGLPVFFFIAINSEKHLLERAGAGPADSRGLWALFGHLEAYPAGGFAAATGWVISKKQKADVMERDVFATVSKLGVRLNSIDRTVGGLESKTSNVLTKSKNSLDAARSASIAAQEVDGAVKKQGLDIAALNSGFNHAERSLGDVSAKVSSVSGRLTSLTGKIEKVRSTMAVEGEKTNEVKKKTSRAMWQCSLWNRAANIYGLILFKDVDRYSESVIGINRKVDALSVEEGDLESRIEKMEIDLAKATKIGQKNIHNIHLLLTGGATGGTGEISE